MKSILAAGVAPYVVTAAGVLMPVRALAAPGLNIIWDPADSALDMTGISYVRLSDVGGIIVREMSIDGVFWTPSPWLTDAAFLEIATMAGPRASLQR